MPSLTPPNHLPTEEEISKTSRFTEEEYAKLLSELASMWPDENLPETQ